jgi:uncharacterized protein (TIGR02145 family)
MMNRKIALSGLFLLILIAGGCEKNRPPRIVSTEFSRQPGIGNNRFSVRVEATDPELDPLTYQWRSTQGTFDGAVDANEAIWVAPSVQSDTQYPVIVEVSDGQNTVSDTLSIPVQAVKFAKVNGVALYTGCKVPVPGAVVTIEGKKDTTAMDGSFSIDGVRVGRQKVLAEKVDFISSETDLLVQEGVTNATVRLTSPIYTCRLYGNITGNISHDPKSFFSVTILNPDNTDSQLTNISEEDGYYEIAGIPFGTVRLIVRDDSRARMETMVFLETNERLFNIAVPEPFLFTDSRDNHEYQAVRVSSQVWMAENLAYIPHVSPSYNQGGIWVYGYSGMDTAVAMQTANYKEYGCLYDWATASADIHGNGKDICPPGWHLPADEEWKSLELALGMNPVELDSVGWRFSGDIGKKIKFESGWESDGNGSNSSSFGAKPAGYRYATGGFLGLGGYATFWTATVYDGESAIRRYLYYNQDAIGRFNDYSTSGFSVRCVRDR